MKDSYVVFLDIENEYMYYAECIECIMAFNREKNINLNKYKYVKISFYKYEMNTVTPNKLEEPLDGVDISSSISKINDLDIINSHIIHTKDLHFHIRIHFSNAMIQMNNLHYISLLLLSNKRLIDQKRFSVFLVPRSGSVYPFAKNNSTDIELYECASTYLRTLIGKGNKGVIYGVSKAANSREKNIVKALDFKCNKRIDNYFPLIVLNQVKESNANIISKYTSVPKVGKGKKIEKLDINCLDHYDILFRNDITASYFSQALKMKSKSRFGYANNETPEMAVSDFIFETSFNNLSFKFTEIGLDINEWHNMNDFQISCNQLDEFLNSSNIFSFAVFSFLFKFEKNVSDENVSNLIKKYGKLAVDLSNALNQIIQNALLHSTSHCCIITFYKDTDHALCGGMIGNNLRIIISDLSSKTIIETFSDNLIKENVLVDKLMQIDKLLSSMKIIKDEISSINDLIVSNQGDLKLKNFFNDFRNDENDIIKLWKRYREVDSSAHIGMAIFSNILKRCGASFIIMSNSGFDFNPANAYSNNENNRIANFEFVIPGTEFNIIVPLDLKFEYVPNGISQLNYKNFYDNYDSYAHFLNFGFADISPKECHRNHLKELFKDANYVLQGNLDKFSQQFIWTFFWLDVLNTNKDKMENSIMVIDFLKIGFRKNFLEEGVHRREVVAKGFINALGIFAVDKVNMYISIINLNEIMLKTFKDIIISLSIKRFPKNLQLFLSTELSENNMTQLHLIGSSYGTALQNSYVIAMSNGVDSISDKEYHIISELVAPFLRNYNNVDGVLLAPFSSFIHCKKDTHITNLFFEKIRLNAEKDMTSGDGYKIKGSHTRLGNKIHIDAFYEMSYLFYRTILANRVAFEIIRSIIKDNEIDIVNDNILFYGYASYSQAILMSLINILRIYKEKCNSNSKTDYAIYQYNLQSESSAEEIQVYLNNREDINCEFKVVQIVPISSTLTTFEKMWAKFNSIYNKDIKNRFVLFHNHTVMWIRDDLNKKYEELKTDPNSEIDVDIEDEYFEAPENGIVKAKFNDSCPCNKISYIIVGHSYWERPDKCKKCYPDELINEIPLVETDPTSTVPSQQIYLKSNLIKEFYMDRENIYRLSKTEGFTHYLHVKRGKNHFQHYIDTHGYFSQVENKVKEWLKTLSDSSQVQLSAPYLNIIFSPEHNTNVGFSQYVNAYYFNGNAEIISINEDKEFRSNFICEHSSLKNIIANLFKDFYIDGSNLKPVRFYFVDDNIITGATFHKSNSLLLSIIPEQYQKLYATNVFEECFFLIDRLSDSSKRVFVYPTNKFHSFCHIDVSNTRKQGDSCIGCKLLLDAKKLLTISATHYSSDYWSKKIVEYQAISFDKIDDKKDKCSYYMMILSHILNCLFKSNPSQNQDIYYKIITCVFKYFANIKNNSNDDEEQKIYRILDEYASICFSVAGDSDKHLILECLIKTLTRPFFTFNQAIKKQTLKLIIMLSNLILNKASDSEKNFFDIQKIYVLYDVPSKLIDFLISILFRALVDLHSTYLIRKETMVSVLRFCSDITKEVDIKEDYDLEKAIYDFWMKYSVYIQKVINCSSDETRSLWLERLILYGDEKEQTSSKYNKHKSFFETITSELDINLQPILRDSFRRFCNEIFINNGHILYQGVKQISENKDEKNNVANSYFLKRWRVFRGIDYNCINDSEGKSLNLSHDKKTNKEVSFCDYLETFKDAESNEKNSKGSDFIQTRYNNMLKNIKNMILEKYGAFVSVNINLAIFTGFGMNEDDIVQLHDLESIAQLIYDDSSYQQSVIKFNMKERILDALFSENKSKDLKELGYYVSLTSKEFKENKTDKIKERKYGNNDYEPYFILRFEVSDNMLEADRELKKIVPVYMYAHISARNKKYQENLIYLILREILTYRYYIIKNLIADFTSDVLQRYAHSLGTETILQTEKEISHSPIGDDLIQLKLLEADGFRPCKNLSNLNLETLLKWVLVRNYCNNMTARLYNRVMHNINKDLYTIIRDRENSKYKGALKLYVQQDKCDGNSIPLKNLAVLLPDENPENCNDEIFKLFSDIIDFKIESSLRSDKKVVTQIASDGKSYTYNLTYTKNIIYRICLDALRFCKGAGAENNNYKQRIINCYEYIKKSEIKSCIPDILESYKGKACEVSFGYEKSLVMHFDWLIIKNRIDVPGSDIKDMTKKLSDPLDFLDGHMSLLAEKEYMSKLFDSQTEKDIIENMFKIKDGYFETRLPLIKKGGADFE